MAFTDMLGYEKTLILTVGLPRSGKSTWSRQQGFPMVNPDSIRMALFGRDFAPEAEPMVWTIARYMVRSLFLAGHHTVILDATNTTERRRQEWLTGDWETVLHVVPTCAAECVRRALENGHPELVDIISRFADSYEPPMPGWRHFGKDDNGATQVVSTLARAVEAGYTTV